MLKLSLVFLSCAAFLTPVLRAITIQDSSTAGYVTGNSVFTGVPLIQFTQGAGSFLCSGALLTTDIVLTAGHCVSGSSNWQVTFQTSAGSTTIAAMQAYLHPNYQSRPSPISNISEYDVAILRLASAAPNTATQYGIRRTLAGLTTSSVVDLVGYGRAGQPGETFASAGVRHHAVNTIDGYLSDFGGVSTPDNPLQISVTYGSGTYGGEGMSAPGDSGGPLLAGNQVLGIASFGDSPPGSTIVTGTTYYGFYANLAENVTGSWVESFLVPEPGTMLLAGAGLAVVFVTRRRR